MGMGINKSGKEVMGSPIFFRFEAGGDFCDSTFGINLECSIPFVDPFSFCGWGKKVSADPF